MKFCPKCGAQVADQQSFCNNCGNPINNQAGNNPNRAAGPAVNPQQGGYQQPNYQQGGFQQPGFQQQGGFQQPVFRQNGGYKAPIQERNIAICILLSIVTCGIYGLYWYFCIINDLNTASQKPEDTSPGMVLLLSIITCGIYGWIWLYKAGEKVDSIKQFNGEPASNSSLLYILLAIFGLSIVDYCLIQTELNKVAQIPAK